MGGWKRRLHCRPRRKWRDRFQRETYSPGPDHRKFGRILPKLVGAWLSIQRDAPVYELQLLDTCFFNPMRAGVAGIEIGLDTFQLMRPDRMGYLPGPLVYRCDHCERLQEYVSCAHQIAEPLPTRCPAEGHSECRGNSLMSFTCIGQAGSKACLPTGTRLVGMERFGRFLDANAASMTSA